MEFRILGPLEVVDEGRALELGGVRQRALLALLLTRANEVVSTDRLIDGLWGEQAPKTASNALQYHVSQLRKTLGTPDVVVTREPGYLIRTDRDELDLHRFERLVEDASASSPEVAAGLLRDALALWRGSALADLANEAFAQPEILRLEELRLVALERRFDADLAQGREADLIGELEALVREHPLRERFRLQLMLALYRDGRQAEALDLYRVTRQLLVEELGIEPSIALQELQRAILRHDPSLQTDTPTIAPARRAIVVVARSANRIEDLLSIAAPLARRPERELIVARLLGNDGDLAGANAELARHRADLAQLGILCRIAAYTSAEPGVDATRLSGEHDVDLLLVDVDLADLTGGAPDRELSVILETVACDVAVLTGGGGLVSGPVVTPFGGVDHDWSAIELAAWLARSLGTTLRLLGTEADAARGRRDASRLLARASLLVQQVVGVVAEPVLVPHGPQGVLDASGDASLLVLGLPERWRADGLGPARLAVAAGARAPTLLVRRGVRPGGVAPNETLTRFTWTLASPGETESPSAG